MTNQKTVDWLKIIKVEFFFLRKNGKQKIIIITYMKEQKHAYSGSLHDTPMLATSGVRTFEITKACKMLTCRDILLKRNRHKLLLNSNIF